MFERSRPSRLVWFWLLCVVGACGGVARQESTRPRASAGAPATVDSGTEADASLQPDAAIEGDAGAPEPCPREDVVCCDSWTGSRSRPTCLEGYTHCSGRLDAQFVDSECERTAEVCHVASMHVLEGTACSAAVPFCPFGRGCSSCRCDCPESTLVWRCECTPC
jgi:hypothetical protein